MADKLGGVPVTFVKAVMDFFGTGEFGRKIEIAEFQKLEMKDKIELRDMLIKEGYEVQPLAIAANG